jgi:S1/P1 Nuclease
MKLRLFVCLSMLLPASCLAWGPIGHRIVGQLAEQQLTAKARAEVSRLLDGEAEPTLPGISNWADELRDNPDGKALFEATRKLHFINFPHDTCRYDAPRDCPDGQCIVAAIARYQAILADTKQPLTARREALKFVVHFVGDVHQPLHAGYADDRGGNQFQINLGDVGTNLHSIWDSRLLETHSTDWKAYAEQISKLPFNEPSPTVRVKDPERMWAEQSCDIVHKPDFYPQSHKMDDAYMDRMRPVAEAQLRAAGVHLAQLLVLALDK